jgi:hypothetical protein
MQRREFLAASAASAAAAISVASGTSALGGAEPSSRQLIELRIYRFASPDKLRRFEQFLGAAAAAFGRAGVEPIGLFKLLARDNPELKLTADSNDLYVVLPHESFDSFLTLPGRLASDHEFLQAGVAILLAPKSDPAFLRYESSLMLGFDEWPKVLAPEASKSNKRVLQLRIYESHSTERARKKIEMFNEGGEIAIFKRVGLNPVFFGQSLTGTKLPNLTYMLAFADEDAMKSAWNTFRGDPEWKKLSADESYKDSVSNITNLILRPAFGSKV